MGARRVNVDLSDYPLLMGIEARLMKLDAFELSRPERQPDANPG